MDIKKHSVILAYLLIVWLFLNSFLGNSKNYSIEKYEFGGQSWLIKINKTSGDTWIWTIQLPKWIKITNDNSISWKGKNESK